MVLCDVISTIWRMMGTLQAHQASIEYHDNLIANFAHLYLRKESSGQTSAAFRTLSSLIWLYLGRSTSIRSCWTLPSCHIRCLVIVVRLAGCVIHVLEPATWKIRHWQVRKVSKPKLIKEQLCWSWSVIASLPIVWSIINTCCVKLALNLKAQCSPLRWHKVKSEKWNWMTSQRVS